MLTLLAHLAFANVDASAIGLALLPSPPPGAHPTGTHAARMAAIRAGDLPDTLVPVHYARGGWMTALGYWHDGHGNVWTEPEVLAILAADPASADEAKRARREQAGGAVLLGVALTTEVVVAIVVPPAAPLVVGADLAVFGGSGMTLSFVGRRRLVDAARAYNLANAPDPDVPGT